MLALSHYETLLSQSAGGSSGNNLAVALRRLGMPILAVERFERAANEKSAQADGNLAHMLIDTGFIKQALEHIKAGEEIEDTNQRVASAAARVRTERDAELATKKDIGKAGSQLREVFVRLDTRTPGEVGGGIFRSQNGHELALEVAPEGLKGKLDVDWDVESKTLLPYLEFNLTKGPTLFKTRASGRGICRDGVLVAYFQDWPSKGMTTPFIGNAQLPPSPPNNK